jgi:hypothetical protein
MSNQVREINGWYKYVCMQAFGVARAGYSGRACTPIGTLLVAQSYNPIVTSNRINIFFCALLHKTARNFMPIEHMRLSRSAGFERTPCNAALTHSQSILSDPKMLDIARALVQETLAIRRAAETRNAVCRADLTLELVVVGEFLICTNGVSIQIM